MKTPVFARLVATREKQIPEPMKTTEMKICQSCGMPLQCAGHIGTEKDGLPNEDYCIFCYKEGAFVCECTMEELIEQCAPFHEQIRHEDGRSYTREEAVTFMQELFPKLKRWKEQPRQQ